MMYKTRPLDFLGDRTHVVYQNVNGPCALLSICNVLLLKKLINLNPDEAGEVSQKKLLDLVEERVRASNCCMQSIYDAIKVLKGLATGINVNVTFNKVDGFEFTQELEIFNVLRIPLYHGWIVNPEDTCIFTAIGSNSYNALKFGPVENGAAERELIDDFLGNTGNQLTDYGLDRLHKNLKEKELCVFFYNDHFNTMFKYSGSLYLLATDEGFFSQTDLVWEKLKVNGDGGFFTSNFTSFNDDAGSDDAKLAKVIQEIDAAGNDDAELAKVIQEIIDEERAIEIQQGFYAGSDDAKLAKDLQEGDDAKLARALT